MRPTGRDRSAAGRQAAWTTASNSSGRLNSVSRVKTESIRALNRPGASGIKPLGHVRHWYALRQPRRGEEVAQPVRGDLPGDARALLGLTPQAVDERVHEDVGAPDVREEVVTREPVHRIPDAERSMPLDVLLHPHSDAGRQRDRSALVQVTPLEVPYAVGPSPALRDRPLNSGSRLLVLAVLRDLTIDVDQPRLEIELLQRHSTRLADAQPTAGHQPHQELVRAREVPLYGFDLLQRGQTNGLLRLTLHPPSAGTDVLARVLGDVLIGDGEAEDSSESLVAVDRRRLPVTTFLDHPLQPRL